MQLEFSSFFVPRNVAWIYFLCHAVQRLVLVGNFFFGEESMDVQVCTAAASPLVWLMKQPEEQVYPMGNGKKAILHRRCIRHCC